MSISVVIPSYNRLNTLPLAIDSVLAQTLSADEIIVIDDGSTDGTSEFVKQHYPSIKLVTQKNAGVSHARNQGIRVATGLHFWIRMTSGLSTTLLRKCRQ